MKGMPSLYKVFQGVITECEGYLGFIEKEASKTFTSDTSRHALGDWIKKVVDGVKGIRNTYSKWTPSESF